MATIGRFSRLELRLISDQEIFQRITLRKGKFWVYEDEYRFARYPDTDYSDLPIRFDGQHAYFQSSELSGITVGARMPTSDVDAVLNLAATHNPRLPVSWLIDLNSYNAFIMGSSVLALSCRG